jgi:hypothetical protein
MRIHTDDGYESELKRMQFRAARARAEQARHELERAEGSEIPQRTAELQGAERMLAMRARELWGEAA